MFPGGRYGKGKTRSYKALCSNCRVLSLCLVFFPFSIHRFLPVPIGFSWFFTHPSLSTKTVAIPAYPLHLPPPPLQLLSMRWMQYRRGEPRAPAEEVKDSPSPAPVKGCSACPGGKRRKSGRVFGLGQPAAPRCSIWSTPRE